MKLPPAVQPAATRLLAGLAALVLVAACGTSLKPAPVAIQPSPLMPVSGLWTPSASQRSGTQTAPPRSAQPSPAPASQHGYDESFPQCPAGASLAGAEFVLVGLNRGKAFSANPCFKREWAAATAPASIYVNSGYSPGNLSKVPKGCQDIAASVPASSAQRQAYAIGCGEALYSIGLVATAGISPSLVWWVDVESANSWSETDLSLNRYALQGLFDQITGRGYEVGLYSTFPSWAEVTGFWTASSVTADWLAGVPSAGPCPAVGFSEAPIWIRQDTSTWSESVQVDSDWTC